jgi:hypothetical protein
MAKFDIKAFGRFLKQLRIDTKDYGRVILGDRLSGGQRYFIREVVKGIEDGVHEFWTLKGRQAQISTIMLAFGLYWMYRYDGVRGSLVTDDEGNRQEFKGILEGYTDNLPLSYSYQRVASSVHGMAFANRSRLSYLVAGRKKGNSRLGQGRGITYMHATEVAAWGCGDEGFASLQASLSQKSPHRLFVYESTAQGFNLFHDHYMIAKGASSKHAIFVPWWMKEDYSIPEDDRRFRVYWDGRISSDERDWVNVVRKRHKFEMTPGQMAWWRWMGAEQLTDRMILMQEFPPIEELAFISSGYGFFSNDRLTSQTRRAQSHKPDYQLMVFGNEWYELETAKSTPARANLLIWEDPHPRGHYFIGADPAYGSNPECDNGVIQVWRGFANGAYQVAELAGREISNYQFAWALVYLCGWYGNSTVNLEVNGPGQSVLAEIRRMRMSASVMGPDSRGLSKAMASMRHFLWGRMDTLGGSGNSIGWVTTQGTKERALTHLKDYFERDMMQVNSEACIREMGYIQRGEGGGIETASGKNDDRVMAAALAAAAYAKDLQPSLIARGLTIERELSLDGKEPTGQQEASQRAVDKYLVAVGIKEGNQGRKRA